MMTSKKLPAPSLAPSLDVVIHVMVVVTALVSTVSAQGQCPTRCLSCENSVAECAKRSLTAPPRVYPRGTKTINLDGNHIRVIAERTFAELSSVEVLRIGGNKIVAIRNDAFSPFPNLVTLDLVDNRISRISRRAFKDLNKLRTLTLNRNKIDSFDGIFQYVPNLFQLNLANNRLTSIGQNDLAPLTRVHYLDLRDNHISSIHEQAFQQLQKLRYLFLNNNPLIPTPQFQFGSEVLQLVDLSYCSLSSVPGPFPSSVTDLRLGHNNIMQVDPPDFLNITDLQLLTLNDNELHFLSDGSLSHLTQLQELWLRNNNLVYIPRNLPDTVRKVYMDSNNVQQIEVGLFSNMSRLEYLTVENSRITRILPNTFRGLRFLNTLNFQGNRIAILEQDTFADLGSLSTVLLSNNPLRKIEAGAFRNLGNLTQLHLSYIAEENFELNENFLAQMLGLRGLHLVNSPGLAYALMSLINDTSATPFLLNQLSHLDLSYNTLEWISPRIREVFPNLVSLSLDGNPLRCSRRLKWLKDWMVSSEVIFYTYSEVVCESPTRLKDRPIRNIEDNEWAEDNEVNANVAPSNFVSGSDLLDNIQQDSPRSDSQPIKRRDNGESVVKKSKDEKEQLKSSGKNRKVKKLEKKIKSGKNGKGKEGKKEK